MDRKKPRGQGGATQDAPRDDSRIAGNDKPQLRDDLRSQAAVELVRQQLRRRQRILLARDRVARVEWEQLGLTLRERDAAANILARLGEARVEAAGALYLIEESRP